MSTCRAQGCHQPVSGFSSYCEPHKRRNRRHGHPTQLGVTSSELEPFRKRVRARIEKNKGNPTWGLLHARWKALVEIAKAEEARYQTGVAHNRYERDAWFNVVKIDANVDSMEVIEVVLAMYLLQQGNPRRFKSDTAFGEQLARRARGLAPTNTGTHYNYKTGEVKKVYRDAKPKTTAILARALQHTFGVAGVVVAGLEKYEIDKLRADKQTFHDALGGLV